MESSPTQYQVKETVLLKVNDSYAMGVVQSCNRSNDTYEIVYVVRKKRETARVDSSLLLKATPLNLAIMLSEKKEKRTPYSEYDIDNESEYTIDKKRDLVVPWAFESMLQFDWLKYHTEGNEFKLPFSVTVESVLKHYLQSLKPASAEYRYSTKFVEGLFYSFRQLLEESILYPMELNVWSEYLKAHADCDCVTVFGVPHLMRLIFQLMSQYGLSGMSDTTINRAHREFVRIIQCILKNDSFAR
ncbi:hypothetical protein WA588_000834, partial [Blastocystis sp. NMH]